MKKVLILGATGMLGSAVYNVLKERYSLVLTVREKDKIALLEKAYGDTQNQRVIEFDAANITGDPDYYADFLRAAGDVDYVINAIGITVPFAGKDPDLTFFINGKLPHILADTFGGKLIHIATDAVFDGIAGFPYDENSPKNPTGIYAESKSLGEPTNCLTLRTSIIGRELEGKTGLLEWFLEKNGTTVKGFVNHFWNGITAREFGAICDRLMSAPEKFPRTGLYHIFSTTVSKYYMLLAFRGRWNVDCEILPEKTPPVNRTLATVHELNGALNIPSFAEMLAQLE